MATSTVFNKQKTLLRSINQHSFPEVEISQKQNIGITINELLPFRIRITDKDIIGFSVTNTPPIPLQIIGLSNYIL